MSPPLADGAIRLPDEARTEQLGMALAEILRPGDCVLLEGRLGAGKTALVRAALRALSGNPDLVVPSPAYSLVQSYDLPDGLRAHHVDLYRLEAAADGAALGLEEFLGAETTFVEWPDRLGSLLPAKGLWLRIGFGAEADARIIEWETTDRALADRLGAFHWPTP